MNFEILVDSDAFLVQTLCGQIVQGVIEMIWKYLEVTKKK